MRRYIDTNVVIRAWEGKEEAVKLIEKIKTGNVEYLVPAIVLEEMVWLLSSLYLLKKETVIEYISVVLTMPNIKVVYKYKFQTAINLYSKTNVKFNDCVIYSHMAEGDEIISYDKHFDKMLGIKRVLPLDLIEK